MEGFAVDEAISAADADREFSRLLRGAREGHSYVVTSDGKPIARIVPAIGPSALVGARAALMARLERQAPVETGRWTRDDLYEDGR